MPVRKPDDARKLVFAGKADAVFISMSAAANEALDGIVKAAHGAKIPTISLTGGSCDKGVILSLAPSPTEQGEAAGRFVARLLKGDSPASIPPEVPKLVELVLNLKEANLLGLKVPDGPRYRRDQGNKMTVLSGMTLKARAVLATACILLLVLTFNTLANIYVTTGTLS